MGFDRRFRRQGAGAPCTELRLRFAAIPGGVRVDWSDGRSVVVATQDIALFLSFARPNAGPSLRRLLDDLAKVAFQ